MARRRRGYVQNVGKSRLSTLWRWSCIVCGIWLVSVVFFRFVAPPITPLMVIRAGEYWANGKPAIQGPYLDYAGMDKYILTAMVPLSLDGVLIGTAGCDTEVRELERVVMPILRTIPGDAALVSKFDRVILGNSGRFHVGNRVAALSKDAIRCEIPGPELGLQLVAAPRTLHS